MNKIKITDMIKSLYWQKEKNSTKNEPYSFSVYAYIESQIINFGKYLETKINE